MYIYIYLYIYICTYIRWKTNSFQYNYCEITMKPNQRSKYEPNNPLKESCEEEFLE